MTTCPQCGQELEIGAWPWCPHGSIYERNAQRWDAIVVWQSNSDAEKYSFPGQASEPCPEGYHRVELTNLREADQFVSRFNGIERRKLEGEREMRHALDDAGVRERRAAEDARGVGSAQAAALRRAARVWADRLRERRRAFRVDPHFNINVLSYDSGHRNSYSGPETGWRERKP